MLIGNLSINLDGFTIYYPYTKDGNTLKCAGGEAIEISTYSLIGDALSIVDCNCGAKSSTELPSLKIRAYCNSLTQKARPFG